MRERGAEEGMGSRGREERCRGRGGVRGTRGWLQKRRKQEVARARAGARWPHALVPTGTRRKTTGGKLGWASQLGRQLGRLKGQVTPSLSLFTFYFSFCFPICFNSVLI